MKKTKSEIHLEKRAAAPILSSNIAKNVSQFRRETLQGEIEQGLYRDGSDNNTSNINAPTSMGNATYSVGKIKKTAQATSGSSNTGGQWRGGSGDTIRQGPEVYSPLWLNSNLNLPRDRSSYYKRMVQKLLCLKSIST